MHRVSLIDAPCIVSFRGLRDTCPGEGLPHPRDHRDATAARSAVATSRADAAQRSPHARRPQAGARRHDERREAGEPKLSGLSRKSGRRDSNSGPLEPHSSALAKLRHAPNSNQCMVMQAVLSGLGVRFATEVTRTFCNCGADGIKRKPSAANR